jgi:hypothetical protein
VQEKEMNPFAAIGVKVLGGGTAAALLSVGALSTVADASTTAPAPAATTAHQAIVRAVIAAEADILKLRPEQLVDDLQHGVTVRQIARIEGISKVNFELRLLFNVRPRLQALVNHHVITRLQMVRVLDRIARGNIPFWNGLPDISALSA